MILVGQYDSPFVRRVAVALHHHGFAYEHRPWSVWPQNEGLVALNPLRRAPVLMLDDGEALVESSAILDAIDDLAVERGSGALALVPRHGQARRAVLRGAALATGIADKAASLLREYRLRAEAHRSMLWIERCSGQLRRTLDLLERERLVAAADFWFGTLSHADIALTCALRFMREAHPALLEDTPRPALAGHAARCEKLPIFSVVVQPLDFTA